jgi:uncharacterized protein YndB with AHSA1/START domain
MSDFTLTWTLDAPPADVFRAWTDPEQLGWYYNPEYPVPAAPIELDLAVGGVWRQYMVIDDETAYFTGGVYREIVPDERLVFSWGATGGWPELDPERLDDSPLVTVTLAQSSGGTALTVHVELPAAFENADMPAGFLGHIQAGWRDTVDRLVAEIGAATAV